MKLRIVSSTEFSKIFPNTTKIAMPWLSDTGKDFGLSKELSNQKKLQLYLQNETEVLEEDENYKFFMSGSWNSFGYLIRMSKKLNLIVYYCKFQVQPPTRFFPNIVTQVEVWRAIDQPAGMAKKVFFDILLPKFKAVMSDTIHTRRGKEFWQILLATADSLNLSIAVVMNGEIVVKPKDLYLRNFYEKIKTWGNSLENKKRDTQIQFMIFDPEISTYFSQEE